VPPLLIFFLWAWQATAFFCSTTERGCCLVVEQTSSISDKFDLPIYSRKKVIILTDCFSTNADLSLLGFCKEFLIGAKYTPCCRQHATTFSYIQKPLNWLVAMQGIANEVKRVRLLTKEKATVPPTFPPPPLLTQG
jgi:hypothetical protein